MYKTRVVKLTGSTEVELSRFTGKIAEEGVRKAVNRAIWLSETDSESSYSVEVKYADAWWPRMTFTNGKMVSPGRAV